MREHERLFAQLEQAQGAERADLLEAFVMGHDYGERQHMDCKLPYGWEDENKAFKSVLAKAVSAFANADGGVIIWGYDVREDRQSETFEKREKAPVAEFEQLTQTLNHLGPLCTEPAVDEVKTIAVRDQESGGYAVTLVSKSTGGPHRAAMGKDNYYYRRRCDRSEVASHYELEDMFGKRPRPNLYPNVCLKHGGGRKKLAFVWDIWNKGRGTAVGVTLEVRVRCFGSDSKKPLPARKALAVDARKGHGALPQIHRGMHAEYAYLETYTPITGKPLRAEDGHDCFLKAFLEWRKLVGALGESGGGGRLDFDWIIGAQNMRCRRGSIVLSLNSSYQSMIWGQIVEQNGRWEVEGKDGKTVTLDRPSS